MRKHLPLLLGFLTTLLVSGPLLAQSPMRLNDLRPSFGVLGGGQWNYHASDFQRLPDVPNCCPQFSRADGFGYFAGLAAEFPLSESFFLQARALYQQSSVDFSSMESILLNDNGESYSGEFEHVLSVKRASLGLEPVLGYNLNRTFALFFGAAVGMVTTTSYDQREVLRKPETFGTFENDRRTRNVYAGELPKAQTLNAALVGGARMTLPLDSRGAWMARPELSGVFGLTPLISGYTWNEHALRLGVAIMFRSVPSPVSRPVEPVVPVVPPPITPPPPVLTCGIDAVGVDANGAEQARGRVRIEEFVTTQMRPLLSYLFFDEGSHELPSRYSTLQASEAGSFDPNSLLSHSNLDTYYHLLNIVGSRLRKHPEANLTITGCNADLGVEKNNRALSLSRAKLVRDYLGSVWGIDSRRMKIEVRNKPSMPSITSDPDGITENRRVELSATIPEILDPLIFSDTIHVIQPPVIRFRTSVVSTNPVQQWELTVMNGRDTVRSYQSVGAPPAVLPWDLREEPRAVLQRLRELRYILRLSTAAGQVSECSGMLPVDQVTVRAKRGEGIADRETDRYDLILFDFNRTELNARNRRIAEIIRRRILPQSTVSVTGYTDRLGEETFNQRLSEERAKATASALRRGDAQVSGKGESSLYPNDLPEGRFYNRTVSVIVETPIR